MKGYATCTCKTCGNEFTKILYVYGKGATSRLEEKVRWAEEGGINECPECWKTRTRDEEKAAGLTCEIRIDWVDGYKLLVAIFGGDSYGHKDALKAAGCKWTDVFSDFDVWSNRAPKNSWALWARCDDGGGLETFVKTIEELGPTVSFKGNIARTVWEQVPTGQDHP